MESQSISALLCAALNPSLPSAHKRAAEAQLGATTRSVEGFHWARTVLLGPPEHGLGADPEAVLVYAASVIEHWAGRWESLSPPERAQLQALTLQACSSSAPPPARAKLVACLGFLAAVDWQPGLWDGICEAIKGVELRACTPDAPDALQAPISQATLALSVLDACLEAHQSLQAGASTGTRPRVLSALLPELRGRFQALQRAARGMLVERVLGLVQSGWLARGGGDGRNDESNLLVGFLAGLVGSLRALLVAEGAVPAEPCAGGAARKKAGGEDHPEPTIQSLTQPASQTQPSSASQTQPSAHHSRGPSAPEMAAALAAALEARRLLPRSAELLAQTLAAASALLELQQPTRDRLGCLRTLLPGVLEVGRWLWGRAGGAAEAETEALGLRWALFAAGAARLSPGAEGAGAEGASEEVQALFELLAAWIESERHPHMLLCLLEPLHAALSALDSLEGEDESEGPARSPSARGARLARSAQRCMERASAALLAACLRPDARITGLDADPHSGGALVEALSRLPETRACLRMEEERGDEEDGEDGERGGGPLQLLPAIRDASSAQEAALAACATLLARASETYAQAIGRRCLEAGLACLSGPAPPRPSIERCALLLVASGAGSAGRVEVLRAACDLRSRAAELVHRASDRAAAVPAARAGAFLGALALLARSAMLGGGGREEERALEGALCADLLQLSCQGVFAALADDAGWQAHDRASPASSSSSSALLPPSLALLRSVRALALARPPPALLQGLDASPGAAALLQLARASLGPAARSPAPSASALGALARAARALWPAVADLSLRAWAGAWAGAPQAALVEMLATRVEAARERLAPLMAAARGSDAAQAALLALARVMRDCAGAAPALRQAAFQALGWDAVVLAAEGLRRRPPKATLVHALCAALHAALEAFWGECRRRDARLVRGAVEAAVEAVGEAPSAEGLAVLREVLLRGELGGARADSLPVRTLAACQRLLLSQRMLPGPAKVQALCLVLEVVRHACPARRGELAGLLPHASPAATPADLDNARSMQVQGAGHETAMHALQLAYQYVEAVLGGAEPAPSPTELGEVLRLLAGVLRSTKVLQGLGANDGVQEAAQRKISQALWNLALHGAYASVLAEIADALDAALAGNWTLWCDQWLPQWLQAAGLPAGASATLLGSRDNLRASGSVAMLAALINDVGVHQRS